MTDYDLPQFAARYGRARGLDNAQRALWVKVLAEAVNAAEVSTVLDVGAGIGRFWPVFTEAWRPSIIIALDRSASMLREAIGRTTVARIVGDLDSLPLRDAAIDVCFCSMSLHYSNDPRRAVLKLARIVRQGGRLCVRTGTNDTLRSFEFLRFFPSAKQAEYRIMPGHRELLSWIDCSGFEVIKVETVVAPLARSRIRLLRTIWHRGFPSLQLVPSTEFAVGAIRYTLWLAWDWLRRKPRHAESTVLLVARRTQ